MATEQEVSRNYEEEKEYDDDDDDYTTEEEEILFDKRITFFSKEDDWKVNLFCYFFLRLHKSVVVLFLYPPQRSCRGVYWFHHVCPSVDKSYVVR